MSNPGFLETIYGVLFDPAATFRNMREAPPLTLAVIVVTVVNLATALMGILTLQTWQGDASALGTSLQGAAAFLTVGGFILLYLKWFGYGAVLHLVSQLLGGQGGPKATLVALGLAGLPSLLLLPVQGLLAVLSLGRAGESLVSGLAQLGVFIWSLVLLIIALREMHGFSARRAAAAVLVPIAVLILSFGAVLMVLILGMVSVFPNLLPMAY